MRLFIAAMSGIACSLLFNPAAALERCVSRADAIALKTAAVQQQMMVAGFMCKDASAYNHFVRTYQTELQESDANLKSYFIHRLGRRGEAAYDTYKTKVANLSALSQARNGRAFCGAADRLFSDSRENLTPLSAFIEDAPSPPGYRNLCINAPAVASSRTRLQVVQAKSPASR